VAVSDFYETVPEGELRKGFSATMHHLMRCGQITVQVEKDGDLVDWMTPSAVKKTKFEERQEKAKAKAAEKAAKEKTKKAKKKATEDADS
jgi:hypothetical protein